MTWTQARAVLPFLSGIVGGGAVIIGILIAWHSAAAIRDRDWQFFIVQLLCATIIGIGGVLFLLTVMEMRKE